MSFCELVCASNFSFLRAASHPGELVIGAKALGLEALGIADRNTLAGVVRAWSRGREIGQRVLAGARLVFADGAPEVVCYPADRDAWARLTRLMTLGQRRAKKGACELFVEDLVAHGAGQLIIIVPPETLEADFEVRAAALASAFPGRCWLAGTRAFRAGEMKRLARLDALGERIGAPMIATADVLYHGAERRLLQDVVTCIREGVTIETAGLRLEANAERRLKGSAEMARLFSRWPDAVARTSQIAGLVTFDLSQLRYEYPDEPVPPGKTAIAHLTDLAWEGAARRYPRGVPDKVRRHLDEELALIEELNYPNYFLTVHDIVRWARDRGILCQGRGSAANSAVCFCLGITSVDPTRPKHDILFARFISREREEPPDIDVDFEHERREQVMQYVYDRYGRDRAAICGTVIHYRSRMAIREVGKALGLSEDITSALAGTVWASWGEGLPETHIRQAGLDPDNPEIRRATALAAELMGFPRHLSQHVGGFVLTKRRLDETVPIGNGAMKDRTFIEWDKDDIDALGLMKVDVLALGMLTAIQRAMEMMGVADLADFPEDDPAVYEMLGRADSVGVFQVESRAQMSMLPRMKPKEFYDLVIEVAIVRPGPIQGDMVHPYLRRREGREPVIFPSPSPEHGPPDELVQVLGKTLGVPLFQEQAMRLAIEAAKFSPEEANGLRRAMATFKHSGDVGVYGEKFAAGMIARGYDPEFAQRCFRQIEGFGSYGFPESHAVSFAKLVWVSAWIKHHRPDVFLAALLNSQPMGFYQPAQLVRDARDHGVEVRPVDLLASDWDCGLEERGANLCAVRLGLRQVRGLRRDEADALVAARTALSERGAAQTLEAVASAAGLSARTLDLLAEADALAGLKLKRREGLWRTRALAGEIQAEKQAPLLALMGPPAEATVRLPALAAGAEVAEDYRTTSLSLRAHPCAFFRRRLDGLGAVPCGDLGTMRDGRRVSVGGLVLIRQRPGTAKGVVFLTLEDESGPANVVIWSNVFQACRRVVMSSRFLVVHGRLQKAGEVIHVVAERFTDLSGELSGLRTAGIDKDGGSARGPQLIRSRDFH
ncbi:MAG TPA: error-prone DNA polymerase [Caulobacteraceae bacterium]|jgi:error-prone DNA polymerase|nr:error-prone DNA polymerase [Caulobacteraceae bacterium]